MKLTKAKKFLTVLLVCLCFQVLDLQGQELSLSHYTQESEVLQLPSAEIQSTYQDQFGYIWFVVYSSGLVRYNGHETVLFTEADGLPLLTVYELLEDPWGRLWVSTDAGLAVTEKPLGKYQLGEKPRFTTKIGDTPLATSAIVHNRMTIDSAGDLWIGTEEDGIIRYHLDSLESIEMDTIHTDYYQKGVNRRVRSLLTLENGAVWVALDDGDISIYHPGNYESSTLLSDSASAPCQTEVLFESSGGEIWGGCWNGTLWKLKQTENKADFEIVSEEINNRLMSLEEDTHGQLWAASYGSGVIHVAPSGSIRIYSHNNGFLSSNINDIFLDREGNLWFAQSGGISKLRNNYQAFTNYSANTSAQGKPVFSNASLNAVLRMEEPHNLIWTATTGGGITIILDNGTSVILDKRDGLLSNRVTSLQEDQYGRIWAGTAQGISCISVLDATAPPAVSAPWTFQNRPARIANYDNHSIYAVKKIEIPVSASSTQSVESIWFPGYQHLYCLVDEKWFVFKSSAGLPSTYYHAITSDENGHLWVGTRDRGVYHTPQAVTLEGLLNSSGKPIPFEDNNQQIRAQEVTQDMFKPLWNEAIGAHSDNVETLLWLDNTLWVGSTSGLEAVEGNPLQSIILITEEAGLKANNITAMDFSKATGTIWIGTNGGLAEIDPQTKQVLKTVTKQNGLVDNEVWYYGSVFVDSHGNILYGTAKGLSIYAPIHDLQTPATPLLQLERASYTENNSGDNEVSFQYAALSFTAEKQIRYKTRLQGFDEDWSDITSENKIRYTNLPAFLIPRQYSFEVLGGYQNGTWTEEPLVHTFRVKPAWWLRWWSFLIQAVIAGFLIFWYVRFKTRNHARALAKEREITNRLKQIDKLKDQFLANTSHELRTPLNGIIGLTESLIDRETNKQKSEDLSLIFASGRRLASLVNDILDFSKMQNEDLFLQLNAVDLRATVNVVLSLSQVLAKDKNLELINEIPEDIPLVAADEDRLSQIFHNLIGNAIKFTPEGFVKVSAVQKAQKISISVTDSGIGIPKDKLKIIFESFKQADGNTAREFGGTGLGLSITKKLIELHGGQISVSSAPGKGSAFIFDLPTASENLKTRSDNDQPDTIISFDSNGAEEHSPEKSPSLEEVRKTSVATILVVDDEAVNRKVLQNHLSNSGYQIVQAATGAQALEIVKKGKKIDLVLLDVMMPKMSGYEVCQKLREKFMANQLPILMITAKNQVNDLIQGLTAGANDYITKPFSKDELFARIKTHLNLAKINFAYGRFVPHEFLRSIGRESILDVKLGDQVQGEVTVFFSDIRKYSTLAETMTPKENFNFLNAYLSRVAPLIKANGGFVNQFLGDGIMALFLGSPDDALKSSIEIQKAVAVYNQERKSEGYLPIKVGIGLHTGPLMLGILGDGDRMDAGVVSDTVNTAARMEGLTKHYGASIIISKPTLDQLKNRDQFNYRGLGLVQVKGKHEALKIYEFFDGDPEEVIASKQRLQPVFESALNDYYQKEFTHAATGFKEVLSELPDDKAANLYLRRSAEYMVNGVSEDWSGVEAMTEK